MEKKKIRRNRPRGLGKRKIIKIDHDPVGVIVVDQGVHVLCFDPTRPLLSIVVAKKINGQLHLAYEIGLRGRNPYGYALRFWDWRPTAKLTSDEFRAVLPMLFKLLAAWVEARTSHWVSWAQFSMFRGNKLRPGTNYYARSYHRPRTLRFKVSHKDPKLLRLFRRLGWYTLYLQRGAGMERTMRRTLAHPRGYQHLANQLLRSFPELRLKPIHAGDLFLLTLLCQHLSHNDRLTFLRWVIGKQQSRNVVVNCYMRYMRRLIDGGILKSFMRRADSLLGLGAVLFSEDLPDRGCSVFRFSLSRLTRKQT